VKVTTKQPEPQKPNVVIEFTPEEAANVARYYTRDAILYTGTASTEVKAIVAIVKAMHDLGCLTGVANDSA
jgi:tetrahydromethanopterin S-methyltransferase subunit F